VLIDHLFTEGTKITEIALDLFRGFATSRQFTIAFVTFVLRDESRAIRGPAKCLVGSSGRRCLPCLKCPPDHRSMSVRSDVAPSTRLPALHEGHEDHEIALDLFRGFATSRQSTIAFVTFVLRDESRAIVAEELARW
jgi:hypothetical protein